MKKRVAAPELVLLTGLIWEKGSLVLAGGDLSYTFFQTIGIVIKNENFFFFSISRNVKKLAGWEGERKSENLV